MSGYDFDLFTIGAGSGGVRATRIAASLGARAAVAEAGPLGGTCVNVGCVPKKLMVYAAHFADDFADARGFGWQIDSGAFDWRHFKKAKDAEILRLNGIYERLLENAGARVIRGRARLLDAHTVEVAGQRYSARHILIATGGRSTPPDVPGAEYVVTSDDVFAMAEQPKSVAIVGGGYIAAEFAGVLHAFGSQTTLIHRRDLLLRGFDEELRQHATDQMRARGIAMHMARTLKSIEPGQGNLLRATLSDDSIVEAEQILYAIGRLPNTQDLGLDNAGVKTDAEGAVVVNEDYQTSAENIYAVGDVINRVQLTPVALAEGMLVARRLFGDGGPAVSYENIPTAVFTIPPLATVGLTEAEAVQRGFPLDVYTSTFRPLKHTLSGRQEKTFMKLLVDRKSDRVLGAHMFGDDAPEIIQAVAVALNVGATKAQFDATIGLHPSAAEEFVTMREKRR